MHVIHLAAQPTARRWVAEPAEPADATVAAPVGAHDTSRANDAICALLPVANGSEACGREAGEEEGHQEAHGEESRQEEEGAREAACQEGDKEEGARAS
jgi:hypothetical protein